MDRQEFEQLLKKYNAGQCNKDEIALLESWYISKAAGDKTAIDKDYSALSDYKTLIWNDISTRTGVNFKLQEDSKTKSLWPRIAGIAAAVVGIAICVWLYTIRHPELVSEPRTRYAQDVAPGHNGATLTLVNGKVIELSDKKSGVIVGDALKYDDNTPVQSDPLLNKQRDDKAGQMIAQTAKGQMYSIILQDGTKVWLNADSKLEFFSNYRNKLQRIVKLLAGEAYFEVAKDAKRPFIVESKGQRVTVLGTHFNISAYSDEAGIKTTLLEGSVRVASLAPSLSSRGKQSDEGSVTLKPGQQSLITSNNGITVKEVDASEAVAWKNGKFRFNNASLEEVMKQLSRWYDVEVAYPQGVPELNFTGDMNRNVNLSETLTLLNYTKLKFRIEGKKIIVTK